MTSAPTVTESNLWPALLWYSAIYLGLSAVVTAVLMIFDLEGNSGVGMGVLVAATAAAARKFVVDHRRAMTRGEQLRFALMGLAATLVITLVQMVVSALVLINRSEIPALYDEVRVWIAANAGLLAIIIAGVVIVYFAVLYFTSGGFSRWFDKRLAATGRI
jgi:hypothetical protein